MIELLQSLKSNYAAIRSKHEWHHTSASLVQEYTPSEVGAIALVDMESLQPKATEPSQWHDPDGLFERGSLPHMGAMQEDSCVIDDAADIRSTAETPPTGGHRIEYRSLAWVPIGPECVLLGAARPPGAFTDNDLETLQAIATVASLVESSLDEPTNLPEDRTFNEEAASFLAHDAGNLLSILLGRVELARENRDPAHFESIERNLKRLEELINDTTTLLRTGETVTNPNPVSFQPTAMFAWQAETTQEATLEMDHVGTIIADESRFCQLLDNLFRNAVEHAGPATTVWVGPLEDRDGFFVEDSGGGINPDDYETLFELGSTSDEAHNGVGLRIVQRIVQAHGWDLTVTNGTKGGARFEIAGVEFAK